MRLAQLGLELLGLVLWCLLYAAVAIAILGSVIFVTEKFQLPEWANTSLLIGVLLLMVPVLFVSMSLSRKTIYAIWPKTMGWKPRGRVDVSDEGITSQTADGRTESVLWSDLAEALLVNEDAWPIGTQYWLLIGRNATGAVVPTSAEGAGGLLAAMQRRLPGFDNREVAVAMGSVSGSHRIWTAPESTPSGEPL